MYLKQEMNLSDSPYLRDTALYKAHTRSLAVAGFKELLPWIISILPTQTDGHKYNNSMTFSGIYK